MKISLIIPTNRSSHQAIARVFEAAGLDSDRFEVIVHDNSEDEEKHRILRSIRSDAVRLHCVPACSAFENLIGALPLATGQFVLFQADDDWIFSKALLQLHELARSVEHDSSVSCISGTYLLETSTAYGLFQHRNIDANDAETRLREFLTANAPNVLFYSAVRRSLATLCFDVLERLPYHFSYHDQLVSLMYIALGRIPQVPRVFYNYDMGEWETQEKGFAKDQNFYIAAGLPVAFDRLHSLLCGMEGALLMTSSLLADQLAGHGEALARIWFAYHFERFRLLDRPLPAADAPAASSVEAIRRKLVARTRELNVNEILLDVADVIDGVDREGARRYFDFWSAL
jgi:hypothetical protein